MGRSPEADFHHGQYLLPVSGHAFTGMPFACLIWCAFRRGAWLVESQRSPLKRFFIKLLYGTPEGVS